MPEAADLPVAESRTIIAMSERLAKVEERQQSTREDLTVVRATLHSINNEMQKFVAAEQKCADYLSRIAESTKDLPAIANAVASFTEMRPDLRLVISEHEQRAGIAAFGRRFAMIIAAGAGLAAFLGSIGAGLVWLSQHIKP